MDKKSRIITIFGEDITVATNDYISLTDMLKAKDGDFLFLTGSGIETRLNIWAFGSGYTTLILIMANSPQ